LGFVSEIEAGKSIEVSYRDGKLVKGQFSGMAVVPTEDYVKSYAEAREKIKEEIRLPALSEPILIIFKSGENAEGDFLGFDFARIIIRENRQVKL